MEEIRVLGKKEYNITAMQKAKVDLQEKKKAGLTLVEEDPKYPQEIKELIEVENERRKLDFEDIDSQVQNLDVCIEEYSKLPLIK